MHYYKIADTELNISFTDLESLGLGFLIKEKANNISLKFYLMNYEIRIQISIDDIIEFESYVSAVKDFIKEKELKKLILKEVLKC